jgi:nucleotide-binding universal stress UspA family protein
MQFKRILCPIDFSDFSVAAYHYALSLAEHYKTKLVVLHAVELRKYPYADYAAAAGDFASFCQALCEGGKVKLGEFLAHHAHPGVETQGTVEQGNASDLILSFAQTRDVELVVMGTHGRRGLDRLVLGSTTDRVMRRAPCPVLVVSSPVHQAMTTGPEGRHRLRRILYCTDFSDNSERALSYAISAAEEYDAELTMLHVAEGHLAPDEAKALIATSTERLGKLVSSKTGLKIKTVVKFGKPYEEIVQLARESEISMIAMTARGGGALDRALFGSTTYRVIQLGPCPVLAVHT